MSEFSDRVVMVTGASGNLGLHAQPECESHLSDKSTCAFLLEAKSLTDKGVGGVLGA